MKEFIRTFLAVLLAGAILMAAGFSWWRSIRDAEADAQRREIVAEHVVHQLDDITGLADAVRSEHGAERIKAKGDLQSAISEVIQRIQAHPMDYPEEVHRRAYALQVSLSSL